MSIFGFYFVSSLLGKAGWPRKQGIFRGESYDTLIVESAIESMVEWGASLGAGRPRLALQMVAEMFHDRNWSSNDAPDIKTFIDSIQRTWSAAFSPLDAVQPVPLAKHFGRSIGTNEFNGSRMRTILEKKLLPAVLWGLSNPRRFEIWYESHSKEHKSRLPLMGEAGLKIDKLPTLSQRFEGSEQIIHDYEREIAPLPSIPVRLLDDAQALGWKLED